MLTVFSITEHCKQLMDTTTRSTEEPYAGKPHVGICEGASGNWCSYLNMQKIHSRNTL